MAEALPFEDAAGDAENHHGPLSLYLGAGFRIHRRDDDGHLVVRKSLV